MLKNIPLLVLLSVSSAHAVNNGLARTPQMGWNNWNSLGCDASQDLLIDTATKLVQLGLRDVGYNYVILDDCWSDGRDSTGKIQVDKSRFPNGMKWVADQMHDKGLKYGMYSSAGEMTCARYEGSLDHEYDDAQSFASWDVDYLEYDNCYAMGRVGTAEAIFKRYNEMARAVNATGRPILYSLCNWGEDFVNSWGVSIGNSYRISGDIYDSFSRPDDLCSCTSVDPSAPFGVAPGSRCSVLMIINRVAPYVDWGQPGGWHDLDMLEVGQGGMTDEEYKAHFAMWAALKSPLLIGADSRDFGADALTILNNPAIIALSQDPLGRPATRVLRNVEGPKDRFGVGETQVWSGPLYGGDQVVIFLNAADKDMKISARLEDIFVAEGPHGSAPHCAETWDVHDLWADRMPEKEAEEIIRAAASHSTNGKVESTIEKIYAAIDWFNSTNTSYKDAVQSGDWRLIGKVSTVQPHQEPAETVPRHSAKVFRLRNQSKKPAKRYGTTKDEL